MFFWVREIFGWLLVAAALFLFYMCLLYVGDRKVVQAMLVATVSTVLFRGGLLMIRLSTAARVVLQARRQAESIRSER